ncbi:hypothetical protein [Nannocystis radixulma]|uniref:Uncharacterized protein n=1 Tax=Nannocystis radixulma TaxID=2995305 RepID=A0ABT5AZJ2_9BACT|nr:hypothetical protein [Nannocystis radixulma]MDC0666246.1 hypothetical protein [Nannocystis radixulma]
MSVRRVASLVPALLLACNSIAPPATTVDVSSNSTGNGPVTMSDVHATLDFTRPGEPVGDLVGWDLGRGTAYAPEGDPLHPEWRTPVMVAAAQALADARPGHGRAPLMRFSDQVDGVGGGEGYHFYRHVEPGHAPAAGDDMATFEYFALMQDADAAPIVTLNFGSGTASEAAAYVRHLNGTDAADVNVAARHHWGQDQPYRQTQFEIGSETYAPWSTGYYAADAPYSYANPAATPGGDPEWHNRPSASAADYAARAREYVAAVRAVEPEARFWVPLSQSSMDAWGGVEAAVQALAPLLQDPAVAGAAIHQYLLDDARPLGWDDPDDLFFALAGVEAFRPGFARARAALDAVRPDLELVVTKYHLAGAAFRGRFARGREAIVGLGVAGMLLFYAQLGVEAACQHAALEFETLDGPDRDPLLEPWYNPFRRAPNGTAAPQASYVATRLVGEHLLERTAPLEFKRQVHQDMSVGTDKISVPLVHAAAFVDPAGEAGTLVALHRDLERSHTLSLDLPPGWTAIAAAQWAPPAADHDTLSHPIDVEPTEFAQDGERVQVTLPPHSLVALRFTGAAR